MPTVRNAQSESSLLIRSTRWRRSYVILIGAICMVVSTYLPSKYFSLVSHLHSKNHLTAFCNIKYKSLTSKRKAGSKIGNIIFK